MSAPPSRVDPLGQASVDSDSVTGRTRPVTEGHRATRALVLSQDGVDLLAGLRHELTRLLHLLRRTRSGHLHLDLAASGAELPWRRAAGSLLPLLHLGLAHLGQRVDPLAVTVLARHQSPVLQHLKGRVDRARAGAPGPATPGFELLDDVVAVHGLLCQQREQRGPDVAPPGPSPCPRRRSEPSRPERAVPAPERHVRALVMVPVPATCLVHVPLLSCQRCLANLSRYIVTHRVKNPLNTGG